MARSNDEVDKLMNKLRRNFPLPPHASERLIKSLEVQALEPYTKGRISEQAATDIWVKNVEEERQRLAAKGGAQPALVLPPIPGVPAVPPVPAVPAVPLVTVVKPAEIDVPLAHKATDQLTSKSSMTKPAQGVDAAPASPAETSPAPVKAEVLKSDQEAAPAPLAFGQVPAPEHQKAGEVLEEQAGMPVPAPPPQKPFVKPEWKVLEPADQSEPVPHELHETLQRNEHWTIAAASVRGRLHAHKGSWREDAYAIGMVDDWTILVVSDGAGSAPLARIGARQCADAAGDKLKELLAGFRPEKFAADSDDKTDLGRVRTFLCEAGRAAQLAVMREAQTRNRKLKDFHATLLVMVHISLGSKDLVAALQVGDGAVGIYSQDGSCTLLGTADHGEYSSETRFITTPSIELEFNSRVLFAVKQNVVALAAMCDGISDDFFPENTRLIELFVGGGIEGMLGVDGDAVEGILYSVAPQPDSGKALLEWMKYEKKGSSDDRTILLMYRPDLLEKI